MRNEISPKILSVLGLGNQGRDYEGTRHNLGFEVVDFLKGEKRFVAGKGDYYRCDVLISSVNVALLKPTTYMNRSGMAAAQFAESEGISPREILVVADDFNLSLGKIRLRQGGSDGGHKGLASVINHLRSENFPRLRLGIGPVPEGVFAEEFVLKSFKDEEISEVKNMIEKAALAVIDWIFFGYQKAASAFN